MLTKRRSMETALRGIAACSRDAVVALRPLVGSASVVGGGAVR